MDEIRVALADEEVKGDVRKEYKSTSSITLSNSASEDLTNIQKLAALHAKIIVQKYLACPCLYDRRKFDLRCFMVVLCCKPYFVIG